jgi:polar amino acid transport system substrate-binding protein
MFNRFLTMLSLASYSVVSTAQAIPTMTFTTLSRGSDQRDLITENIVKNAYLDLGFKVKITTLPGLRALKASNNGDFDGELRRSKLDSIQYPNLIKVDTPVNAIEICAYSKHNNLAINSATDLSAYNVGFQIGGRQSTKLASYAKEQAPVNKIKQLMHMLTYDRIDLAIGNCSVVKNHITEHKIEGIFVVTPPLVSKNLYHYIHTKHKHMLKEITAAILKSRTQYLQLVTAQNND